MPKVYMIRKKLNEDVSITDPALAQQFLAVKKQMADKRTKRDQLMKNVNTIDSELNILEKNLIAIETKAAQQQGETSSRKPAENQGEQQAVDGAEIQESLNKLMLLDGEENDYREEVIDYIANVEEYPDAETIVWEFSDILDNCYIDDHPVDVCAKTIIQAARDANESISYDFEDEDEELDEDGTYFGGDTQGKMAINRTRKPRVMSESAIDYDNIEEVAFTDSILSINGEEKTIEEIQNQGLSTAIVFFTDGTSMPMEELEKQDVKFIDVVNRDDEYEAEWEEADEREMELLDLRRELEDIEKEERQAMMDMEQELANYDESSWVPDVNPRKSISTGETIHQTMPHDVWGGILNDIQDRKEEVQKQIKELTLTEDQAEYGRSNMGPTNLEDDEDVYKVEESIYNDLVDKLEDEKEKLEKIQDFIIDMNDDIEIDVNLPTEIDQIPDEEPEILEPEEEPEVIFPIPVEEKPDFDILQVEPDVEDDGDPYDMSVHSAGSGFYDDDPLDDILQAENKPPYQEEPLTEEELETEVEMMNYELDDQERDEYVFHVKIDESTDHEIVAKIYRDDEDDFWTVRVVKGDEEPLQSMEFDPRLDKLEIIAKLADIYDEITIIDAKEYEYLLDDKEKVDAEYYEDLD